MHGSRRCRRSSSTHGRPLLSTVGLSAAAFHVQSDTRTHRLTHALMQIASKLYTILSLYGCCVQQLRDRNCLMSMDRQDCGGGGALVESMPFRSRDLGQVLHLQ